MPIGLASTFGQARRHSVRISSTWSPLPIVIAINPKVSRLLTRLLTSRHLRGTVQITHVQVRRPAISTANQPSLGGGRDAPGRAGDLSSGRSSARGGLA